MVPSCLPAGTFASTAGAAAVFVGHWTVFHAASFFLEAWCSPGQMTWRRIRLWTVVHLPVALFQHDHIVCVCHAPAHRILAYYVGAVTWFWHLAGGAGVVVVDVVSTPGTIIVVSITMI